MKRSIEGDGGAAGGTIAGGINGTKVEGYLKVQAFWVFPPFYLPRPFVQAPN